VQHHGRLAVVLRGHRPYGKRGPAGGQILWEQMILGYPEHGVRHALAHDGPALVDVDVSPDEPPLPGKVEYEQAKKFAQAFLRGQPHKATIATTLFKDKIQQLKS
jgi:pyruvate dehydrogenase (quinone)/pyruvate oxidase